MSEIPLSRQIQKVRDFLKSFGDLGNPLSERYLIESDELSGIWFCFQNGDVRWRFSSSTAELFNQNGRVGEFELECFGADAEESKSPADSKADSVGTADRTASNTADRHRKAA